VLFLQGELGLTRSENLLLKRDLDRVHKQLGAAQEQMRRYQTDVAMGDMGRAERYSQEWE
jgi:hypothetical protein